MKLSRRFTSLVVVLVALGLMTGMSSAATNDAARAGKGPDPKVLQKLREKARGSVTVSTNDSTEYYGFVRAGRGGDLLPGAGRDAERKSNAFLAEFGSLLGLENAGSLARESISSDRNGSVHVTYKQVYRGVPVFGGTVKTHVDSAGDLTAVNGTVVPNIDLDATPRLSAAEAAERAIAAVVNDPPVSHDGAPSGFLSAGALTAASTTLYVYRTGLIRGTAGSNQLVYEVEVTNGANVRDFVYVHANAGKVVNRFSAIHDALFRRVFEQNTGNQVWQEGDPFPGSLNQDQQNIVNFTGESYWHFWNAFGRDSYDGAGHEMWVVNNDPTISCPNANWNGATTNYCNGVTSDDVVAHEWGHAYTEYTHNLIYQWQQGALNESYSDIWGEVVDMLNGVGTDTPATTRTPGVCSAHTTKIPVLVINGPAEIAGLCAAGAAQFGAPLTNEGVTQDIVLGLDGVGGGDTSTTNGCTAFTNAADVAGKIALVDRGFCAFTIKVKNAQNAGAIGAVIANTGNTVITMSGSDTTITIPALSITLDHGNLIKGQLAEGDTVNVTMKLRGGAATPEDSYRWLLAEDSTAFNPTAPAGGHAIRDMWEPTCLADPGKVTDAEYQCDTSDGGGVHTNSGVPNHGFALLVDGGTYNGQTVAGIGVTKAAHIYWRAQSVYQTRISNFVDHADSLEASCTDLTGVPLTGLSVTSTPAGPSGQMISAADCASVAAMIAAVELRHDPTEQCNFGPLLDPNTPSLCANQKNPPVVFEETFEDGLAGWTLASNGRFSGWPGLNWAAKSSLPGGRAGTAAYAVDPDGGSCDQGAGDFSGTFTMDSPTIALPETGILSPRLSFEHYVLTEFGFDGGNVRVSVNGGPFELVPASAFQFNPYNTTLQTAAQGNTNPMAGEHAFSGTDGGVPFGSWGQSQIDLTEVGIKAGDSIQLRFVFGLDGCSGIDGWYVDDVKVSACNTKKKARD